MPRLTGALRIIMALITAFAIVVQCFSAFTCAARHS